MEQQAWESHLPELGYAEGFTYLFEPLSHLTSSRHLFGHKLSILIRLSRETHSSHFTRAEMERMFPQYEITDETWREAIKKVGTLIGFLPLNQQYYHSKQRLF